MLRGQSQQWRQCGPVVRIFRRNVAIRGRKEGVAKQAHRAVGVAQRTRIADKAIGRQRKVAVGVVCRIGYQPDMARALLAMNAARC